VERRGALPPQQASEATDTRLLKLGARVAPTRPHLVSTEHWSAREAELDPTIGPEHVRIGGGEGLASRVVESRADVRGLPQVQREPSLHAASKRVLDVVGALILGAVFAPLILAVMLVLQLEGGPIIYRHRRIGRDGMAFECLKFRSMVPNAERALRELLEQHSEMKAEWVRDHKLRCDPRVTRLGGFLRRTSLDELPQLWNVLRGEMSLVGPRPIVREELMRYGRCLSVYLSSKPGITGLWQVTGRNNTDYRRRVALDVYYVRKQSLLLDLYILFKTPRVVLGGGGAY
jgi:exopolysaccharide production protein ExoY